jgi:hypothetical protein
LLSDVNAVAMDVIAEIDLRIFAAFRLDTPPLGRICSTSTLSMRRLRCFAIALLRSPKSVSARSSA